MARPDIYLFSPLSIQSVQDGKYCSLLLHFLLIEIFRGLNVEHEEDPGLFLYSSSRLIFPYDWTTQVGPLNKFAEHMELLPYAFPKMKKECKKMEMALAKCVSKVKKGISRYEAVKVLHILYKHLKPFLMACNQSEPLQFFLKNHQSSIERLCAQNLKSFSKTR